MTIANKTLSALATALLWLAAPAGALCPPDSVEVGALCVDKYEASVWKIPADQAALIAAAKAGTITSAGQLAGSLRRGASSDDYDPGCTDDARNCVRFYALSIPGVVPSRYLTWFQASAACRNAGKRLLTNAEWQVAALGTPLAQFDDASTTCNIGGLSPGITGSRSACVSDVGVRDMVGGVAEWVADWDEKAIAVEYWIQGNPSRIGGDGSQLAYPAALVRGGSYNSDGGAFAVSTNWLDAPAYDLGFRCAR